MVKIPFLSIIQRAAVTATPGDAALRGDALEVADQDHAEVGARRNRGPALLIGVVRAAEQLQPQIALRLGQPCHAQKPSGTTYSMTAQKCSALPASTKRCQTA